MSQQLYAVLYECESGEGSWTELSTWLWSHEVAKKELEALHEEYRITHAQIVKLVPVEDK